MMKSKTRKQPAERISQAVLYAVVGLAVVVFALFRFVGYDTPYYDNPELNAPLLTDVLVGFMSLLTLAAVIIVLWAACRSFGKNRSATKVVNGIHAARLARIVVALVVLTLAATFMLGSTHPITVNGEAYADAFWLRTAAMFVDSSLLLIAVAVGAVVFGTTRSVRKDKRKR